VAKEQKLYNVEGEIAYITELPTKEGGQYKLKTIFGAVMYARYSEMHLISKKEAERMAATYERTAKRIREVLEGDFS
jgi:hypothetical protein